MRHSQRRSFGVVGLVLACIPGSAESCDKLASLKLPATTITVAELVTGGKFVPPGQQKPIENLPEFCRVAGAIKPSADSDIRFEVWMPRSGWNGRFQGIGNGGFAGSISYGGVGLANAVKRGYATASTDTGHSSEGASWALGHPEKLIDYGHRAIHETAVKAKAIIRAFYGEAPKRSYFASCSNGGRQALMEAQRYPDDYDGVIAGAPANNFTRLLLGFVWNLQALDRSVIPATKLPAIEAAVLAQCDAHDGVKDGVLNDPPKCKFDPGKIACRGLESDSCLTTEQVGALKRIYEGPRANGKPIFRGFDPGGETPPNGWNGWIIGRDGGNSAQHGFGTQFLKNMVFQDANYDFRTFNFDRDVRTVEEKVGPILNATDPDLTRFKERRGKLILFHGWCDAAIPPRNAIDYFNAVKSRMGSAATESFVRLYMVPGLKHCSGGPGPNSFGAYGEGSAELFDALVGWVEKGSAPKQITATKFAKDGDPASGAQRTRPLCPHPQIAHYKGAGSIDDAANFECKAP